MSHLVIHSSDCDPARATSARVDNSTYPHLLLSLQKLSQVARTRPFSIGVGGRVPKSQERIKTRFLRSRKPTPNPNPNPNSWLLLLLLTLQFELLLSVSLQNHPPISPSSLPRPPAFFAGPASLLSDRLTDCRIRAGSKDRSRDPTGTGRESLSNRLR